MQNPSAPASNRSPVPALLAVLALGGLPGHIQGAEPTLRMNQDGQTLSVEGSLTTAVERTTAWAALTDYERFPQFVPGMRVSQVVEDRGPTKRLDQRGEITGQGPALRYEGLVEVTERNGSELDVRFLGGPFVGTEGQWRIQDGKPLTLRYRLRLDLARTPLPPPLAMAMTEQQVRAWVTAFAKEMERRQKGGK